MQPSNGLMSDLPDSIDLPEAQIDEDQLNAEKGMAQYTTSAEFKQIQDYCQGRIEFYQTHLPNGAEIGLDVAPSSEDWRVANRVIGELKALMNNYETAADAVKEDDGKS